MYLKRKVDALGPESQCSKKAKLLSGWDCRKYALSMVKKDGMFLKYVDERFKDDKEIVLEAFKQNQDSIIYVEMNTLVYNNTIVEAIKNRVCKITSIPSNFEDNIEIYLNLVKYNGVLIYFASRSIKDNKVIVMNAVKSNGLALAYVSERLRDDKDVVLASVSLLGTSINYASNRLKNDRIVIFTAIIESGVVIRMMPQQYMNDKNFIINILRHNPCAFKYINFEIRFDKEVEWVSKRYFKQIRNIKPDINFKFK
jgi:hypothetical protein